MTNPTSFSAYDNLSIKYEELRMNADMTGPTSSQPRAVLL